MNTSIVQAFNDMQRDIDRLWGFNDAISRYSWANNSLHNDGLKAVIDRPHNLINVKDENGNIVAQRLEVVTTPFNPEDVKVSITDNILSVSCGDTNKKEEKTDDYLYKSISSRSYRFQLKISDDIDKESIKAENKNGILKITFPINKEKSTSREIAVEM